LTSHNNLSASVLRNVGQFKDLRVFRTEADFAFYYTQYISNIYLTMQCSVQGGVDHGNQDRKKL